MKEKDLDFSFEFVDKPKISKEINQLNGKKACQEHDIPVKLIKSNKDLFSHFIYHNFNNSLFSSNFPSNLKAADILPTHKKKDKLRTIVQLVFFLLFLRSMKDVCMIKCINTLTKFFLNINAVFYYNTQHCLLMMAEKWKEALDKGRLSGALVTYRSIAFDCIK